jgi:hypothetical protein
MAVDARVSRRIFRQVTVAASALAREAGLIR